MKGLQLLSLVSVTPFLIFGLACTAPSASEEGRKEAFAKATPEQENLLSPLLGDGTYVVDGETTRSELIDQLGAPSGTYEGGKILAFWFAISFEDRWLIRSESEGHYVFMAELSGVSESDELVRHSLIFRSRNW